MMSSLLLDHVRRNSDNNDEVVEHVRIRITTDKNEDIAETNQIHHYIFRRDALAEMSFYEFCRCIHLETKSKRKRPRTLLRHILEF